MRRLIMLAMVAAVGLTGGAPAVVAQSGAAGVSIEVVGPRHS